MASGLPNQLRDNRAPGIVSLTVRARAQKWFGRDSVNPRGFVYSWTGGPVKKSFCRR
jgi:hypothetical protein